MRVDAGRKSGRRDSEEERWEIGGRHHAGQVPGHDLSVSWHENVCMWCTSRGNSDAVDSQSRAEGQCAENYVETMLSPLQGPRAEKNANRDVRDQPGS